MPIVSLSANNKACTVYAEQTAEEIPFGVRNTHWGMTMKEVKAVETAKFEEKSDKKNDTFDYTWQVLNYPDVKFCGETFELWYHFTNDGKLFEVSYMNYNLSEESLDEKFNTAKDILVEKYGEYDYNFEDEPVPITIWNDIGGCSLTLMGMHNSGKDLKLGIYYTTNKMTGMDPNEIIWDEDISSGAGVYATENLVY